MGAAADQDFGRSRILGVDTRLESLCPAPRCDGSLSLDDKTGVWVCDTCRRAMELLRPSRDDLAAILSSWRQCRVAGQCSHSAHEHRVLELVAEIQRLQGENDQLMAALHRENEA